MHWWLVITAVIAAALAYGYWDHRRESRRLARLLAVLAATYRGDLKKASHLVLPQLRFELNGRRFLVTAMATSGQVVAGSSGYSGPFTFVDLDLAFDCGQKIRVERSARSRRVAERLIDAVSPGQRPMTGHEDFDAAFRIPESDQVFASRLLDQRVRRRLLNASQPRLDVRVDGRRISVHMDGYPKSKVDLEELIDIAVLLADRCPIPP